VDAEKAWARGEKAVFPMEKRGAAAGQQVGSGGGYGYGNQPTAGDSSLIYGDAPRLPTWQEAGLPGPREITGVALDADWGHSSDIPVPRLSERAAARWEKE
jgi:hypothetical protein